MTTPSPDPRPRPQYGEYASPQEQRAHIRQPQAPPAPTAAPVPEAPAPAVPARAVAVDRIVTIAMLAYGAVSVIVTIPTLLDLAPLLDQVYKMWGVPGTFTATAAARGWGIVAAAVLAVGFVATAFIAGRMLRRGRRAWWIPLVGAVVTYIVMSFVMIAPLMADPALASFLQSR